MTRCGVLYLDPPTLPKYQYILLENHQKVHSIMNNLSPCVSHISHVSHTAYSQRLLLFASKCETPIQPTNQNLPSSYQLVNHANTQSPRNHLPILLPIPANTVLDLLPITSSSLNKLKMHAGIRISDLTVQGKNDSISISTPSSLHYSTIFQKRQLFFWKNPRIRKENS